MGELRECFGSLGFSDVTTYINSGNVIFESAESTSDLRPNIENCLYEKFGFQIQVVVIEAARYQKILALAPKWWGKDPAWRHNLIFLLKPHTKKQISEAIGELKPEIEEMLVGKDYIFQSLQFDKYGRTTFSKVIGKPLYKQMTIRNYNTAIKLEELLKNTK